MTIRVVVVDDHPAMRAGLERILAGLDDVEVVATAADGHQAVAVCGQVEADVVLMDLSMPVLDGVEATRRIAAAGDTRVVVLTTFCDRERILAALDAGAAGYLLKDAEPGELAAAVRAAAAGDTPLAARAATEVVAARARPDQEPLSPREQQVVDLVAAGMTNFQIARRLGIAERTVKAHLTHIFGRIGVADRTQVALWAQRQRLGADRSR